MELGIRGRVALITGSGRGLGKAIALLLAQEGATVVLNSRSQEDLEDLLQQLPLACGEKHRALCRDLTLPEGPAQLFAFLQASCLLPDIVVHNVGGNLNITDPLCSIEQWREVMRINVEIPVELNRLLIPPMQKKRWGRVCHVSSISALENQGPPSYSAAKAGLVAYTRSLGRFTAKDGVVITSVLPGAVFTEGGYWDIASRERPAHVEKYLAERMAIQRFGKPSEIAGIVAFLCSEQSSFCIGSSFLADGGQGRVFFNQEPL